MTDALITIEQHAAFMLAYPHESPDEFRESFQKSNIIHDLRWLAPGMEFTSGLLGMEFLHTLDSWGDREAMQARAYLEGVEMFLEGVRIGYRYAQKKDAA